MKAQREQPPTATAEALEPSATTPLASAAAMTTTPHLTLQDFRDHLTGPVVSFIAHIILLAFLSTMIVIEPSQQGKEIEVELITLKPVELTKPIEPPEVAPLVEPEPELLPPELDAADEVPIESAVVTIAPPAQEVIIPSLQAFKPNNSALTIPIAYQGRIGQSQKQGMEAAPQGTPARVLRGLRWLRDHQNEDGSWGDGDPQYCTALTGMALLAFLAHNDTPAAATEFSACVLKAIKRLATAVEQGGGYVAEGQSYAHGIVTYALAEAYAMTGISLLVPTVNQAVTRIIAGQSPRGGFNYGYDNTPGENGQPRQDLSVSGWSFQALKAAQTAGLDLAGLDEAVERSVVGLKTIWHQPDGGFGYDQPGETNTMTAVGTLCLMLMGAGQSPEARSGLKTMEEKWFQFDWDQGEPWFLYRTYYQTQAHFQAAEGHGPKWDTWNKRFSNTLVRKQFQDGHWETPAAMNGAEGHGEGMFKGLDMPVYATSLSLLMLQVYVRYLPTFKVVEPSPAPPETGKLQIETQNQPESTDLPVLLNFSPAPLTSPPPQANFVP